MASQTSSTVAQNYTAKWASAWSILFPPEIWKEWYQKYGDGLKLLDFLRIAGMTTNVAARTVTAFEDGALERPIKIAAAIPVGAAGATISFTVHADSYDSDGNCPLRDGFDVIIPAAYQPSSINSPRAYRVTRSGSAGAYTFTGYPYANGTDVTKSQIAVEVPLGTELMIGASSYAPGTGQPAGIASGTYQRSFYTRILKESCGFEGGQIAQRKYWEVIDKAGNPRLFDRGLLETEFRLDSQVDKAIFLGEYNDNSSMVATSQFGGSNKVLSGYGLFHWLVKLAQKLNYTTEFTIDDFDDIKPLLQTQGVVDQSVLFALGSDLNLQLENAGLEFLQQYSASDLMQTMDKVGFQMKAVQKNGITFMLKELGSFSNPQSFGLDTYYSQSGFITPLSQVKSTVNGESLSLPHLSLGYLNHNGEDRSRIIRTVDGMSGIDRQAVNEYDGSNVWMLTELMLIAMKVNQMILVRKAV